MKHDILNKFLAGTFWALSFAAGVTFFQNQEEGRKLNKSNRYMHNGNAETRAALASWKLEKNTESAECWVYTTEKRRLSSKAHEIMYQSTEPSSLFSVFSDKLDFYGHLVFRNNEKFDDNITVTLSVGDMTFILNTDGYFASSPSKLEDEKILALMKTNYETTITLSIASGATDIITFNLDGFREVVDFCE